MGVIGNCQKLDWDLKGIMYVFLVQLVTVHIAGTLLGMQF